MTTAASSLHDNAEDQARPDGNEPKERVAAILDPAEAFDRIVRRAATVVPLSIQSLNVALGGGVAGMDVLVLVGPPRSAKTTIALWIGLAVARVTGRKLFIYAPDQGSMSVYRWLRKVVDVGGDEAATLRKLVVVADESRDETDLKTFVALLRHRRDEIAAVLLDSAQTLLAPGAKDELSRVTASMSAAKTIGDELIVPVIVASQANRSSWRSSRNDERSSPLSAGLNGSAVEYRATIQIFCEKVSRKGEPPEFRLTVAKSAHGKDDYSFRLILDPETMTFSESPRNDEDVDEISDDEVRRWKELAGAALTVLGERWTAGETPSIRDLGARLRAVRSSAGLSGPSNDKLVDLIAYLERTGAVVLNPGPRNAKVICRPSSVPVHSAGDRT